MNNEDYAKEKAMDLAIRHTAIALKALEQYATKKEKPYIRAVLKLIADNPQEFRKRGYVVNDGMFVDHKRDKRGNVVKVRATFDIKEFTDYYTKMQKEKMK